MTIASSPPINFDALVDKFVKLRDRIKAMEAKHKEELAPFKEMRDVLESHLLAHLNAVQAENVKTASGTVYKTTKDTATLADRSMFWGWVMTNSEWDAIDVKANVSFVRDFIEDNHTPPPGVNFSSVQTVGVKRPAKDS